MPCVACASFNRCVHQPNESKINLIALISFYCIHPALKLFKRVMSGFSMLGRIGSCMAFDRLIDWIDFRQGQRNSTFRAFDRSLQYTPELQPMMHVDAATTLSIGRNASRIDVSLAALCSSKLKSQSWSRHPARHERVWSIRCREFGRCRRKDSERRDRVRWAGMTRKEYVPDGANLDGGASERPRSRADKCGRVALVGGLSAFCLDVQQG